MTRFWQSVDRRADDECWPWLAGTIKYGYGTFRYPGGTLAHRFAYTLLRGPIPDGLVSDHLCRNPNCVNPWHIELVTLNENTRRGDAGKHNRIKTHCKQGHEFTPENTYLYADGKRRCKICARRWSKELRARRQAQHPTPA